MTIDPSTPGEAGKLYTLLLALEWEDWPDERIRKRVLRLIRAWDDDIQDRLKKRYEAGRAAGLRVIEKQRRRKIP